MTVEEIKEQYTMRDIVSSYGIQIKRNGMCSCPFHADRHPSMKIYPDGFKCFSCGEHGDIFKFIERVENCSFKDAFLELGGTYEAHENTMHKELVKEKFARSRKLKNDKERADESFKRMFSKGIDKCKEIIHNNEPFSDEWCEAQNNLQFLLGAWDEKYIEEKEVNEIDVIRICRKIGC